MKRFAIGILCGLLVVSATLWINARQASAMPGFAKVFTETYVDEESQDPIHQGFAAAVKKVRCNVCHMGKSKKDRNVYGVALAELLEKDDKDDVDKIKAALEKVAGVKPDDEAPTFGELIKQGKLPGGEVE